MGSLWARTSVPSSCCVCPAVAVADACVGAPWTDCIERAVISLLLEQLALHHSGNAQLPSQEQNKCVTGSWSHIVREQVYLNILGSVMSGTLLGATHSTLM